MAQNPFKTPEFKRLFKEWNHILLESGFQDAEDFSLPEPALKTWSSSDFSDSDKIETSKDYYALAAQLFSNGFRFNTDVEYRIWELHCSGKSERQIEIAIRSQLIGYKGKKKTRIHEVIFSIQRRSGIKRG